MTLNGFGTGDGSLPSGGTNTNLLTTVGRAPAQWLDLVFATGASNPFGIRLSIGGGFERDETEADYVDDGVTTRSNTILFNLVAGYTIVSGQNTTELSAELGFGSSTSGGENKVDEEALPHSSSTMIPAISLLARQTIPQGDSLSVVGLAGISFGTARDNQFTGELGGIDDELADAQRRTTMSIFAGGGPVYTVRDRATVTADIGIGYIRRSEDPHVDSELAGIDPDALDNDLTINQTFVLPSVRIAGEFFVSDRFTLRMGARSVHTIDTERVQPEAALFPSDVEAASGDGDDTATTENNFAYFWTAGMGYRWGEFSLDAAFNTAFLTNGPYFLSGAATSPWVGIISMRYEFGNRGNSTGGGGSTNNTGGDDAAE